MIHIISPANLHVKRWLGSLLAASVLLVQGLPSYAASNPKKSLPVRDFLPPVASINPKLTESVETSTSEDEFEPVALSAVQSPVLHASPKINKLDTDLSAQIKTDQLENLLEIQKKVDEADLEYLWQATVEKNPVIRFSLEKLATPADLQSKQSSRFMTKTLNTLISGATMGAAMIPGASMYQNMGSMAVGNALQNMVNGKTPINHNSLSETENIQLAGLIDQLKLRLIHSYQDYKNTLQNLAQSHATTAKNNSLYSKALTSKNDLAIMAAGTAYYQALLAETNLKQKAKLCRMELERLAGPDAVSHLELAVHVPENVSTASAIPVTDHLPTPTTNEFIGPLPIEMASPSSNSKINELIGPELPPAKIKSPTKSAKNVKSPLKNDIPQPMEIGPKLKESNNLPPISLPEPLATKTMDTLENTIQ